MMRQALILVWFVCLASGALKAKDWDWKEDRRVAEANGWIWTGADLSEGFAQARNSGKPLMVVLRCPP